MLLNILQCTGQPPTIRNNLVQNVNSAQIENFSLIRRTKCLYSVGFSYQSLCAYYTPFQSTYPIYYSGQGYKKSREERRPLNVSFLMHFNSHIWMVLR